MKKPTLKGWLAFSFRRKEVVLNTYQSKNLAKAEVFLMDHSIILICMGKFFILRESYSMGMSVSLKFVKKF